MRFLPSAQQAILINTGGGLAGGDDLGFDIRVGAHAQLCVTSQAAERVYRTLGPAARVHTALTAEDGARLYWLPQETILFDGSALHRSLDVELAATARFLAVEAVVFGRREMGEDIDDPRFRERWRLRRGNELMFADDIVLSGALPNSTATLDGAGAMATLVLAGSDAETVLASVRQAIGDRGSASAWNGKLVARVAARDGFKLRQALIPALWAIAGVDALPTLWTL